VWISGAASSPESTPGAHPRAAACAVACLRAKGGIIPVAKKRKQADAIKDTGASKKRTKEIADRTVGGAVRKPARQTATGQGGADKGRRAEGGPDTGHISERGGVKADSKVIKKRTTQRKGKHPVRPPAQESSKDHPASPPAPLRRAEGRGRVGARGPARSGIRTRGRSQGSRASG
jgi:hypothetical protein